MSPQFDATVTPEFGILALGKPEKPERTLLILSSEP